MFRVNSIAAIAALTLAGCSNSAQEKFFPVMPKEIAHCRFFLVTNDKGDRINVALCPGQEATAATYKNGKREEASVVVIGGKKYVSVDEPKGKP